MSSWVYEFTGSVKNNLSVINYVAKHVFSPNLFKLYLDFDNQVYEKYKIIYQANIESSEIKNFIKNTINFLG